MFYLQLMPYKTVPNLRESPYWILMQPRGKLRVSTIGNARRAALLAILLDKIATRLIVFTLFVLYAVTGIRFTVIHVYQYIFFTILFQFSFCHCLTMFLFCVNVFL